MTTRSKPGLLGRWREWTERRRQQRLEAKARSSESLKHYKPPSENSHGGG